MGLKTTNYNVKNLGIILPNAYALIEKIEINEGYGVAKFAIQTSRNAAEKHFPIETKEVSFKVNRNENPYVTAYNKAKSLETFEKYVINPETRKPEKKVFSKDNGFYGWEDDII